MAVPVEEVEAVLRNAAFSSNEELKMLWSAYCRQEERDDWMFTWLNTRGSIRKSVFDSVTILQSEMGRMVVEAEEGDDL